MIRNIAAPKKYCRFVADDKIYNGTLHGNMVDLVEGDFLAGFSTLRMSYPLDRVKLLPPVHPTKVWCVGRNYVKHVRELGHDLPEEPMIFMKPTSSIVGNGDPVRIPEWAGRVDYEGELAVVIGRRARRVSEDNALSCVAGYSCFNDVTARDLQNSDGQWTRAKGFDTFGPLGPVLLLAEGMPDETRVTTRLNGKIVQQDRLGSMIFSVPRIISHISRFATLEPGDVIATGTPEGVGPVKQGDRVEVEIDGIGTLANPFVADHF
ncbi:MAG: fumarylacetoacetate hydrolase family protein [Synergistaceae bacterium]|jgi:2-keto-4-pentenoate hydratase/2-oxohepta-3-ene-1,7-dioic acid hydratase in catechol pathway|nr:fumarylacetoacetate hydrolase family protein [Synergistaceae bacterium]